MTTIEKILDQQKRLPWPFNDPSFRLSVLIDVLNDFSGGLHNPTGFCGSILNNLRSKYRLEAHDIFFDSWEVEYFPELQIRRPHTKSAYWFRKKGLTEERREILNAAISDIRYIIENKLS